jgi:pyruvate dehydrogenase E2 component (dihydrolipoamide acetyltransferase)
MPTDVIMPQMGESIFEGTITKWLKKPGDTVERDEPLFEISTDKVDAEIPSPASGVLTEVKIAEGNTVQINTVVGVIGEANGQPAAAAPPAAETPAKEQHSRPGGAPKRGRAFHHRRDHAPDGRVHFRRHHYQVAEEAGRCSGTR